MSQNRIQIPTLGDKLTDFKKLFSIVNDVKLSPGDIVFDFSHCNALRPNAVAFLGGIARLAQSQVKKVEFDWASLNNKSLNAILCQNDFARIFGKQSRLPLDEAIPYREDKTMNMNPIMDYLTNLWLGRGWVHVSMEVRDAIVGKMWEIYNNAFEHSGSGIGVFSCGEHITDDLILTVVDFGDGIPQKVRNFLSRDPRTDTLSSISFFKWAFQRGHSTCMEGVARGLGLDLLKEFVQVNHGKLEIYSNDVYVIIDKNGMKYKNLDVSFEGTVVHITLRCDENLYYQFKHEVNPQF